MKGNTKSRAFIFTVNNYDEFAWNSMKNYFATNAFKWIIGKEVGESGTPHLQAYARFKNPRSFNAMKKLAPRAHIETARADDKMNFDYCSKEGDFTTNIDRTTLEPLDERLLANYNHIIWKDWQARILNLLNDCRADSRSIHWVYDPIGNSGKSFLVKYIYLTYKGDVVIADGKKDNVYNQVFTLMEHGNEPKIIILDVPRSCFKYVNYAVIENLKNGLIYSGKYEGGVCAFENPHVIIFSNNLPDRHELSKDRLVLIDVSKDPDCG